MIPEAVQKKALDWVAHQNFEGLESLFMQDCLFDCPAFLKMKQDFLSSFKDWGDDQATWIFLKSFNDVFLSEKNYISCPIW